MSRPPRPFKLDGPRPIGSPAQVALASKMSALLHDFVMTADTSPATMDRCYDALEAVAAAAAAMIAGCGVFEPGEHQRMTEFVQTAIVAYGHTVLRHMGAPANAD